MSGYFAEIAARESAQPMTSVVPGAPVEADRGDLSDPFETDEQPADGMVGPSAAQPHVSARPADVSFPPVDVGPLDESPSPTPIPSDPVRDDSEPTLVAPPDPTPTPTPSVTVEASAAASNVAQSLNAMDEMLFAAAGVDPPPALDIPEELTQMSGERTGEIAEIQQLVPALERDDDARDSGAGSSPTIERFVPAVDDAPVESMTPPAPPTPDGDGAPTDVHIGKIVVEVHTPATDRPAAATSPPALRSAPRPERVARAQRSLTPQRRGLR